jgi:hypothetical protein
MLAQPLMLQGLTGRSYELALPLRVRSAMSGLPVGFRIHEDRLASGGALGLGETRHRRRPDFRIDVCPVPVF